MNRATLEPLRIAVYLVSENCAAHALELLGPGLLGLELQSPSEATALLFGAGRLPPVRQEEGMK